jgi:hypothetical protein
MPEFQRFCARREVGRRGAARGGLVTVELNPVLEAMRCRRVTCEFLNEPVSVKDIRTILLAARWASTARARPDGLLTSVETARVFDGNALRLCTGGETA